MFSDDQIAVLRQPISKGRVYQLRGNSYLATWDVRAHLTRIFGYGMWDFRVRELTLCDQWAKHDDDGNPSRFWATYRCVGRLVVRGPDYLDVVYEDAAVGDAQNQPSSGDAHDLAVKSAASGALKRCAVNLGTQFGLSLYAGTLNDVVVKLVTDDGAVDGTPDVELAQDLESGDYQ